MDIYVTPQQFDASQEMEQLAIKAILNGGSREWDKDKMKTRYGFDEKGELLVLADHYHLLYAQGIEVEHAALYAKIPASMTDNYVDVDLPYPKYTDVNGIEQRRKYDEYFKWKYELADSDWLVRLVPRPYGSPAGRALTIEEFRDFYDVFGSYLLGKGQGEALIPAD